MIFLSVVQTSRSCSVWPTKQSGNVQVRQSENREFVQFSTSRYWCGVCHASTLCLTRLTLGKHDYKDNYA